MLFSPFSFLRKSSSALNATFEYYQYFSALFPSHLEYCNVLLLLNSKIIFLRLVLCKWECINFFLGFHALSP